MRDTRFIKFLAICLIANSHLEKLYPISWLAADGLIGNSLFFMLSGFGVVTSEQAHQRNFIDYYWRRVTRIYPSLLLVILFFSLIFQENWKRWELSDYITQFIYPTFYGFITQIMIFYIGIFFLMKLQKLTLFIGLFLILFLLYFYIYITDFNVMATHLSLGNINPWMHWIFYFQVMLLGSYLGNIKSGVNVHQVHKNGWIILSAFILIYLFLKLSMVLGYFSQYYFLIHLCVFPIIYYLFMLTTTGTFPKKIKDFKLLYPIIALGSSLTLEIYLTHSFVINWNYISALLFPINIFCFYIISFVLSFIVEKVATYIRAKVKKRIGDLRFQVID